MLWPINICCNVVMQSSRTDFSLFVHCMYFFPNRNVCQLLA
jgi:hypothetical protein